MLQRQVQKVEKPRTTRKVLTQFFRLDITFFNSTIMFPLLHHSLTHSNYHALHDTDCTELHQPPSPLTTLSRVKCGSGRCCKVNFPTEPSRPSHISVMAAQQEGSFMAAPRACYHRQMSRPPHRPLAIIVF